MHDNHGVQRVHFFFFFWFVVSVCVGGWGVIQSLIAVNSFGYSVQGQRLDECRQIGMNANSWEGA